jgi:very-short-patch-repair endonuclease
MTSELEATFAFQIRALGLPTPQREYRFAPPRLWRFDFAWPDRLLAVEVEGGTWTGGRHTRGAGFTADCEKYNTAVLGGWRVLRFTGESIADGSAVALVDQALSELAVSNAS